MATLLQTINKVLVRLRESEVGTPSETDYSKLVCRLVNDAVHEIQSAHSWNDLKTTVTASVSATDTDATFSGTNTRTRILDVYDSTSDDRMFKRDREWIIKQRELSTSTATQPTWWAFKGYDSSGNVEIELYPEVDGAYTLTADVILPDADLTSGSDVIRAPEQAVYLRALALAIAERGEDGGSLFADAMQQYQIALNDAVTFERDNAGVCGWYVP